MYLITYNDQFFEEFRAETVEDIRQWMKDNEEPAAFNWAELERSGEVSSICGNWHISSEDAEAVAELDRLNEYSILGGQWTKPEPDPEPEEDPDQLSIF